MEGPEYLVTYKTIINLPLRNVSYCALYVSLIFSLVPKVMQQCYYTKKNEKKTAAFIQQAVFSALTYTINLIHEK